MTEAAKGKNVDDTPDYTPDGNDEDEEEVEDIEGFASALGHAIAATAGAFDNIGEATTSLNDSYIFVSALPLGIRNVAVNEAYHFGLAIMGQDDDD